MNRVVEGLDRLPMTSAMRACLQTERAFQSNAVACLGAGIAVVILLAWAGAWPWIEQSVSHMAWTALGVAAAMTLPILWSRFQVARDLRTASFSRYGGAFRFKSYDQPSQLQQSGSNLPERNIGWALLLPEGELIVPSPIAALMTQCGRGEIDFATHQKLIFEVRDAAGAVLFRHPRYGQPAA